LIIERLNEYLKNRLFSLTFINLFVFILLSSLYPESLLLGSGIERIKNSLLPLNKSNGKTITFKEVLRIQDSDPGFFFKYPKNIKTSNDGSIFIMDKKQLLKFDGQGKFLRNFYKYGQGPGEIISLSNYLLDGNRIIIHDSAQNKIIIFNHISGEKVDEFRFLNPGYLKLLYQSGERLFFRRSETPETGGKLKLFDVEVSLIQVTNRGHQVEKKIGFPIKHLIIRSGERYFSDQRDRFIFCFPGPDVLYVSHTSGYNVKQYSFTSNSIIREFNRQYKRVKVSDETKKYAPGGNFGKISIGGDQWFKVPVAEYHPDIQKLVYIKNQLWVITSTYDKAGRVLVDIFTNNGVYADKYYLNVPPEIEPFRIHHWILGNDSDSLFLVEEDKMGQRYIKKCTISR
jgi:6-bladed beta-propeller